MALRVSCRGSWAVPPDPSQPSGIGGISVLCLRGKTKNNKKHIEFLPALDACLLVCVGQKGNFWNGNPRRKSCGDLPQNL